MTTSGWIMMGVSLSIVWIGTIVCYRLILSSDKDEKVPTGFGP